MNKNRFVPEIGYKVDAGGHNLIFLYKQESAFLTNNSFCMVDNGVKSNIFSITDNYRDNLLWLNLTINNMSNGDRVVTPQYNLQLYQKSILSRLKLKLSLEGWYQMHSKESSCYYSPKFVDSTSLGAELKLTIINNLYLSLLGSYGYSKKENSNPYDYGFNLGYPMLNQFEFNAGCLYYSSKRKKGAYPYSFNECNANLNYRW